MKRMIKASFNLARKNTFTVDGQKFQISMKKAIDRVYIRMVNPYDEAEYPYAYRSEDMTSYKIVYKGEVVDTVECYFDSLDDRTLTDVADELLAAVHYYGIEPIIDKN